jgi:hypothetical protein
MTFSIPSPIVDQIDVPPLPTHRFFDHLFAAECGVAGYFHSHMSQLIKEENNEDTN